MRMSENTLTIRDNRTGKEYVVPIENDTIKAMDLRKIKVEPGGLRHDDVRPRVPEHGVVQVEDHLHRRRQGDPRVSRLPDRAARREVDLPRGGLAPLERRAADGEGARGVHAPRDAPHLPPREHQEVHGGVPARRAPDGDAPVDRRRSLDLLPRRQARSTTSGSARTTRSASSRRCRRWPRSPTGTRSASRTSTPTTSSRTSATSSRCSGRCPSRSTR